MSANVEAEFEAIATRAVEEAERVKCPAAAYRDGLQIIIGRLEDALTASESMDGDD